MQIGIPRERLPGETRVAATPETVKKYVGAGHTVVVEQGAGEQAFFPDALYEQAGAAVATVNEALAAELVLKVRTPTTEELGMMRPGGVLVGMLDPFNKEGLAAL